MSPDQDSPLDDLDSSPQLGEIDRRVAADDASTGDPEGLSVAASLAPLLIEEPGGATHWWRRKLLHAPPWVTSALVHSILLLVLGLWTLPGMVQGLVPSLTASSGAPEEPVDLWPDDALPLFSESADTAEPTAATEHSAESVAQAVETSFSEARAAFEAASVPESLAGDSLTATLTRLPADRLIREERVIVRRSAEATGSEALLVGAGDLNAAVDGLTGQIESQLAEGDLLVVWLLDASLSLVDDRQQVAERLDPFFRDVAEQQKKSQYKLLNATVAFGRDVKEVSRPTLNTVRTVNAIANTPVEPSGIENVFSAVQWCVEKYRKNARGGLLIIVWTDESGDDILRLEETIDVCQKYGASVSVVGPTAVLGREPGIHAYRLPQNGMTYLLPVKKGPDTAIPERLRLPYWFLPNMPGDGESVEDARFRMPPIWQGGVQLEGLASGFGPYALTRLARETGGTFTILDRPMDRAPFTLEVMRKYVPELGPAESYRQTCEDKPLSRAVLQAVQATYADAPIGPPNTLFFGGYLDPAAFRNRLKGALADQRRLSQAALAQVDRALVAFGPAGMEDEFQAEYNPRWRAWYDLTRGRLLAVKVRYLEYLALSELVVRAGALDSGTNHIEFAPAAILRTGESTETLARESERLLRRCLLEHKDTPWALLAQRELDNAVGLDVVERSIPKPRPVVAPVGPIPRGGGGRPGLPNL